MCCPRFCARLRPSAVRVRTRSRSTSARPPSTAIISRPVLAPVSAHGSAKDRNCALASNREKVTGARADRRELNRMLGKLAPDDVVMVTRIRCSGCRPAARSCSSWLSRVCP